MRLLYTIFIYIYLMLIKAAALFSTKAAFWINGRKNIRNIIKSINPTKKEVAWIHAASLGEFEQGRPLIEEIRKRFPETYILLTFFSPSGYEIRKNYTGVDKVLYLPIDTPANARFFISQINPAIAVFIKYEYWYNYLHELNRCNIPVVFISAIFRPGQHFFKAYGSWFRTQLKKVDWFFVQHQSSLELLNSIGIQSVTESGDTRFDRVHSIAQNVKSIPEIAVFKSNKLLLIAGSTWPADEAVFMEAMSSFRSQFKIIIAPHEVHADRIVKLMNSCGTNCIRYSEISARDAVTADILIIDNIGILSSIYQYADFVYIGGGFGKGIHNILEAATFVGPVFFGPNYLKFQEAKELIKEGGAFSIETASQLKDQISTYINDASKQKEKASVCRNYVSSHTGATGKVMLKVSEVLGQVNSQKS